MSTAKAAPKSGWTYWSGIKLIVGASMYEASAGKNTRSLTVFRGPYINLTFQDGPIKENGENGTTNEEILRLLMQRIESLNLVMHSHHNDLALDLLRSALYELEARTRESEARGVEGTNAP